MLHSYNRRGPSPFKFQRMWVTYDSYGHLLKDAWDSDVSGLPMHVLVTKLKIFRLKLKSWNFHIFGNVHQNLWVLEDKILEADHILENGWDDDIGIELNRLKALHKKAYDFGYVPSQWGVDGGSWLVTQGSHFIFFVYPHLGGIGSFHTPRNCTPVTHLLYADDTIIFLNGRESSIRGCMKFLDRFCACSGQKINVDKSSFMMYSGTPSSVVQVVGSLTGFHRKSSVMTYLGAPICVGRLKVLYFDGLLTKIRNKLAGWKANFLSQGGKLIMIRHVLSSMAIYLIAAVAVPKSVLLNINRLIANFFWGSHDGKPKRKWVSWDAICRPVLAGGLGIRNIEDVVNSFRLRNLWNGFVNKSIWATFISGKYTIDNFSMPMYVTPRTASKFWKECAKLIPVLVKNSAWKVGNGDMNFWLENWGNVGILADVLPAEDHSHPMSLREAVDVDFIIPGLANASIILARNLYEGRLSADTDTRLWALTTDGIFTVKSAFMQTRNLAPSCPLARFFWAKFIPMKLLVFFWRAINRAVPVDVRIQNCNVSLASGCVCCMQRQIESFEHLFMRGDIASSLWDYFSPPFGIQRQDFSDFWEFIWAWFTAAPVGSQMGFLGILIPMVIMHRILKWIYDINPMFKVIKQSPSTIRNVLLTCRISLSVVRRKPVKVLRWRGVIRDNQGWIVAAFHRFYGSGTNNLAESRALLDGLDLCSQMGLRRIAVRVDSKLVASWYHYKSDIPWTLLRWWQKIRERAQDLDLVVSHVYREVNAPADFMANMGLSCRSDHNLWSNFPPRLVGLARLDRLGIPYLRNA
ncbi:Ribonuclease H domain [Macleaya cordata]|uniref:Ribonuclease H domain n=1 Tax=Macleaya cordata TaxID=56857 RepID=A0A200QUX2_MACCD|nr:Ribonuclease H domain [Macleaya cordata]